MHQGGNGQVDAVHQFGRNVLNTVAMMLGNIEIQGITDDMSEINSSDHTDIHVEIGSIEIVIGIFMLFICIVVMNVLIGLTVSRTDYFVEIADLKRLRITAEAIKSFEYFGIKGSLI